MYRLIPSVLIQSGRIHRTTAEAILGIPLHTVRRRERLLSGLFEADIATTDFRCLVVDDPERAGEQVQADPPGVDAGAPAKAAAWVGTSCGMKDGPTHLHVRVWTCRACGTVLDRDINEAAVTKAAGLAVTACTAGDRPVGAAHPAVRCHLWWHHAMKDPFSSSEVSTLLVPVGCVNRDAARRAVAERAIDPADLGQLLDLLGPTIHPHQARPACRPALFCPQ